MTQNIEKVTQFVDKLKIVVQKVTQNIEKVTQFVDKLSIAAGTEQKSYQSCCQSYPIC